MMISGEIQLYDGSDRSDRSDRADRGSIEIENTSYWIVRNNRLISKGNYDIYDVIAELNNILSEFRLEKIKWCAGYIQGENYLAIRANSLVNLY